MTPRLAYSIAEAAETLSLSVRSVRYLMSIGKVGYVKVGRRRLIRHEDLERLLRQGYCRATDRLDADALIRPRTPKNAKATEPASPMALDVRCDPVPPGSGPHPNARSTTQGVYQISNLPNKPRVVNPSPTLA